MATQPTNLPVPSESPRGLKFNAGKIDEFVTSPTLKYLDRFGVEHYTIEGLRWLSQQAISQSGYIILDSFEDGNTLTLPNQVLRLEATGEYYRWDGSLPKTVPAGSTPETSGGIGLGAWLSVGDATVRGWVKSNTGLSDTVDELIANLNKVGAGVIHGTHEVPSTGLGLPIGTTLTGVGQRIVVSSGDLTQISARGFFTKSTNDSVTLVNPNNSSNTETVDAIAYITTDSLGTIGENEIFGSGVVVRDVAFKGIGDNENEVGLHILNGGYHILENIQVHNTKYGFKLGDVYLSNLIRCHTWGAIQQMSGTSTHYDNVWARGHLDVLGAFHFENLNYSVLDSCCSDRPRRGAFYFKNCVAITLNSCATEGPGYFNNLGDKEGGAIIFDSGNRVTLNNFQISPLSTYSGPLITVGDNNNIIIDRLFTNNGAAYTGADLYVYGNDSYIEVKASQVRTAKNMPLIHIEPGSTSKVVVWLNGGNRAILTSGATKASPSIEYEYEREAFNPILLIGESSTGIAYASRSGTWAKSGNMVTVNFTMTLSSKGSLAGNLSIGNLPFNMPSNSGGIILNYANMANGPFVLGNVTGGPNVAIRRVASSTTVIATQDEINNDSVISGCITYQIASSGFNTIPS
ncbi:tail fiber/spike domain-containing protein [Escherichia coli]